MQSLYELIDTEKWKEAIEAIDSFPSDMQARGRVKMLRADCLYESGDDLGALAIYSSYLEKWPNGRDQQVALMGVACSLLNLQLETEALGMLRKMEDGYPRKLEYIQDIEEILQKQEKARVLIAKLQ